MNYNYNIDEILAGDVNIEDIFLAKDSVNLEEIVMNENAILKLEVLLYSLEVGCDIEKKFKINFWEILCYILLLVKINDVDITFIKVILNSVLTSFSINYLISKNIPVQDAISDEDYMRVIAKIIEIKKNKVMELKSNDIEIIDLDGSRHVKVDDDSEFDKIKRVLKFYRRGDITEDAVFELLSLNFDDYLAPVKKKV